MKTTLLGFALSLAAAGTTVLLADDSLPVRAIGHEVPLVNGGRIFDWTISPDGEHAVYQASELIVPRQLFSAPLDGGAPILLTSVQMDSFSISPDSEHVVFLETTGTFAPFEWSLYSVPIDGGPETLLAGPLEWTVPADWGSSDYIPPGPWFRIRPDSRGIVFRAEGTTVGQQELYHVPITGGPITRVNEAPVAGGNVVDFAIAPDSTRVVYYGDLETDGTRELFSRALAGGAQVSLSPPGALQTYHVGAELLHVTPDSARVVFTANPADASTLQLFSVPIDGSSAAMEIGDTGIGRRVIDLEVSSDSQTVVFLADRDSMLRFEVYSVPVDGSVGPTRLNDPFLAGDVKSFTISPDDAHVVFRADIGNPNVDQLWSAPLHGGASMARLNDPPVVGGDVTSFRISHDSQHVVYRTDEKVNDLFELYSTPIDGTAAPLRLHPRATAGGDVTEAYALTPSGHAFFLADGIVDEQFELLRSSITDPFHPSDPVRRVNPPLPTSARDVLDFVIDEAGARVLLRADVDANDDFELFTRATDIEFPATKVNQPLRPRASGRVDGLRVTDDGDVAYLSDSDIAGSSVHVTPLDGSAPAALLSAADVEDSDPSRAFELSHDQSHAVWTGPGASGPAFLAAPLDGSAPFTELIEVGPPAVGLIGDYWALSPTEDLLVRIGEDSVDAVSLDGGPATRLFDRTGFSRAVDVAFTPDGAQVLFLYERNFFATLRMVPSDGSQSAITMSHGLPQFADLHRYQLTPDGTGIVYETNEAGHGGWDLWYVPIDRSAAPVKLNDSRPALDFTSVEAPWTITPDSNHVVYFVDATPCELVIAPLDGSQSVVPLDTTIPSPGNAAGVRILGGDRAVFFVSVGTLGYRPYSVPLDASAGAQQLATSSRPPLAWSPDEKWLVFLSDEETTDRNELFAVRVDGSGGVVKLNSPLVANHEIHAFAIAPDSSSVLFHDVLVAFEPDPLPTELCIVPIDGSAAPEPITTNGYAPLAFTPDGSSVLFRTTLALSTAQVVPKVDTVSPLAGSPLGGTRMTIRGSGFTSCTTVEFDGVPATSITFVNETELSVVVPPLPNAPAPPRGASANRRRQVYAGPRDVAVTVHRSFFESQESVTFTYLDR